MSAICLRMSLRSTSALLPTRERRRQLAEDLYHALVTGGYSFWEHIHPLFHFAATSPGTICASWCDAAWPPRAETIGRCCRLFGMAADDYKRFMNFLATHDCRAEFREFRNPDAELTSPPRAALTLLPPLKSGREQQPADEATKKKAAS